MLMAAVIVLTLLACSSNQFVVAAKSVNIAAEGITTGIQLIPDAETASDGAAPRPPDEGRAILNTAVQKLRENDTQFGVDITRLSSLRE
jgi:hypothetical protein